MLPKGALDFLFSSAGTYPRPFSITISRLMLTLGSMLQITNSGLSTWYPEMNFWKSPAVNCSFPLTEMETVSLSTSSICLLKRTCFRFKMISVTSSTTPGITENSCSTPSMRTEVMAKPSKEESNTLLNAFPTVNP